MYLVATSLRYDDNNERGPRRVSGPCVVFFFARHVTTHTSTKKRARDMSRALGEFLFLSHML